MHLAIAAVVGLIAGGIVTRLYYHPAISKLKATEQAARNSLAAGMTAAQKKIEGK